MRLGIQSIKNSRVLATQVGSADSAGLSDMRSTEGITEECQPPQRHHLTLKVMRKRLTTCKSLASNVILPT